jgi:cyclic pyranopterin phosphate synthase
MLERLASRWPLRELGRADDRAPSVDYAYADGAGRVGLIGSVTEPFCGSCTRARLTADGKLVTCLFAPVGHDLKALLRGGASDEELATRIHALWTARTDRFSDERWDAIQAGKPYRPDDHRKIEMITLGG